MKALISLDKRSKKRIQEDIKREREKQLEEMTRRIVKLCCVSLHKEFGFSNDRQARFLSRFMQVGAEREQDEVFWAHIDQYCKSIGLDFPDEDYDKMDDPIGV